MRDDHQNAKSSMPVDVQPNAIKARGHKIATTQVKVLKSTIPRLVTLCTNIKSTVRKRENKNVDDDDDDDDHDDER